MQGTRTRRHPKLLTALVAAVLATSMIAACGGDDDNSGTTSAAPAVTDTATTETTQTTTESTTTETSTTDAATAGKEVFVQNCGSCHTLADAGTSGKVGPNLDDTKPSESKVSSQVKSGGNGMPAFEGVMSEDEIEAVSEYVADVAGS